MAHLAIHHIMIVVGRNQYILATSANEPPNTITKNALSGTPAKRAILRSDLCEVDVRRITA